MRNQVAPWKSSRARVLRAPSLRAADRMAADEARRVDATAAHRRDLVEPTSVTVQRSSLAASVAHQRRQGRRRAPHTTASVGAGDSLLERHPRLVDGAALERATRERARIGIAAADTLDAGARAASPIEPPMRPSPTIGETRDPRARCRAPPA